jgi:hypothetical protein
LPQGETSVFQGYDQWAQSPIIRITSNEETEEKPKRNNRQNQANVHRDFPRIVGPNNGENGAGKADEHEEVGAN